MTRQQWMRAALSALTLGAVTLVLAACSSSKAPTGNAGASGGAVVGVAIPNSVAVVTANNSP